jgi:glyoxylase-like metal-dependent hydrolase (beta-lactamase superfamily II)
MIKSGLCLIVFCALLAFGAAQSCTDLQKLRGFVDPANAIPPPASAFDPEFQGAPYTKQLTPEVYLLANGFYNSLAILHRDGVVLVDAPPFFSHVDLVRTISDEPITHLIYSHSHSDHIGGALLIKQEYPDVEIIAHKKTKEILKRRNDPNRPIPDTTFSEKKTLNIGGRKIKLEHPGFDTHGTDSIFIESDGVLMFVDVVFPGWVPFKSWAVSVDIHGAFEVAEMMLEKDFHTYVGGHLGRIGNKDDVQTYLEFFEDVMAFTKEGQELYPLTNYFNLAPNFWAVLRVGYTAVADYCAQKIMDKYSDRLAGLEFYAWTQCDFAITPYGVE